MGIELTLVTENVYEAVEKALLQGAVLVQSPVQKIWGQTVAYIRDLDGILLEICTLIGG